MPLSGSSTRRVVGYHLCAAAVLLCTLWANIRVYQAIRAKERHTSWQWREEDYRYLGDDHPPMLLPPSQLPRNIALVTEETVHYWPHMPEDWESMTPAGSGGFVRLGPQKRLFGVAMYHQLRCLRVLQQATAPLNASVFKFDIPPPLDNIGGGVHHCLNYLRQMFLCAANLRLEPLTQDRELGGVKTDGIGLEHRCRDWTVVRRQVEANIEQWRAAERIP